MNYGRKNEGSIFSSGGFDLAIPEQRSASAFGEPNVVSNVVRLFYCNSSNGSSKVAGTIGEGGKKVYCTDISKSWYFGIIWGKHYGVTFAVKPEAILNPSVVGKTLDVSETKNLGNEGLLNPNLVEILKEATGTGENFMKLARERANKKYDNCRDLKEIGGGSADCFRWNTKFSKNNDEENKESNCSNAGDEFDGCSIGIIDVSRCTRENQIIFLFQNEKNF